MFSEEFLLQSPWYNRTGCLGVKHQLTYFSYSSDAKFSEEFLLHSLGYVWWGASLTLVMLVLVRSYSYTPQAMFDEEFLLHSLGYVLVRSFSCTPHAIFSEEFLLHGWR